MRENEELQSMFDGTLDTYVQKDVTQKGTDWQLNDELSYVMKQEKKKTKREYYKCVDRTRERSQITLAAALVYFATICNLIVNSTMSGGISIDAIFLVCLALGLHMKQSRVCAGILMVYAIINAIIVLIMTGKMTGILLVIAGIYALKGTMGFAIEWKLYCEKWDREQSKSQ